MSSHLKQLVFDGGGANEFTTHHISSAEKRFIIEPLGAFVVGSPNARVERF
ncbi:hypothetical protein ACI2KR_14815 [Pseudomonas luteola]